MLSFKAMRRPARQAGKVHKPGAGHPIVYPDSLFVDICRRYSEGENLLKILKEDGMPTWATFWNRCIDEDAPNKDLVALHARARLSWAGFSAYEIAEIADTQEQGRSVSVTTGNKASITTKTEDMLGHRKLRIDARRWFVERIVPAFTPKTALINPDGSPIFQPLVQILPVEAKK